MYPVCPFGFRTSLACLCTIGNTEVFAVVLEPVASPCTCLCMFGVFAWLSSPSNRSACWRIVLPVGKFSSFGSGGPNWRFLVRVQPCLCHCECLTCPCAPWHVRPAFKPSILSMLHLASPARTTMVTWPIWPQPPLHDGDMTHPATALSTNATMTPIMATNAMTPTTTTNMTTMATTAITTGDTPPPPQTVQHFWDAFWDLSGGLQMTQESRNYHYQWQWPPPHWTTKNSDYNNNEGHCGHHCADDNNNSYSTHMTTTGTSQQYWTRNKQDSLTVSCTWQSPLIGLRASEQKSCLTVCPFLPVILQMDHLVDSRYTETQTMLDGKTTLIKQ